MKQCIACYIKKYMVRLWLWVRLNSQQWALWISSHLERPQSRSKEAEETSLTAQQKTLDMCILILLQPLLNQAVSLRSRSLLQERPECRGRNRTEIRHTPKHSQSLTSTYRQHQKQPPSSSLNTEPDVITVETLSSNSQMVLNVGSTTVYSGQTDNSGICVKCILNQLLSFDCT